MDTYSKSIVKHAMPRISKKISVLLCVIFFAASFLSAQNSKTKQIEELMATAHRVGVFNGNVLVVDHRKTIYQAQFGASDASGKRALDAADRFNIGSIAKEFNGVAIMMLKEQGKLALDDKVSKYLIDLPAWADGISIKNLLQYTSGLPDINWQSVKSDADILRDLKLLKSLNSEPGAVYAYNNSNVFLQRRIIEKITGEKFSRFVEKQMLAPCGMTSSVVDPEMPGRSIAISFNNERIESPRQFAAPMSGWTSVTAEDLYKWNECLHNFKLITKPSLVEILIPFAPGKQSSLGGGSVSGEMIVEHYHQGSSSDFEALMYTNLPQELTVILLTNNKNSKLFDLRDSIKAIVEGKPYKMPRMSLLRAYGKALETDSGAELIARYEQLKNNSPNDYNFDDEKELNQVGYDLLRKKRIAEAVKIFELNVRLFPESANVYDSLGEGLFNAGDTNAARLNYKKSLELNPQNSGAQDMLKKIENKP